MPPQRLYFCLAVNAKRMGFLLVCFLGACQCVGVVIEGLFVCHRTVDKRGRSPLNRLAKCVMTRVYSVSSVDHFVVDKGTQSHMCIEDEKRQYWP